MQNTYKILITGRVQGVGFRPFVYNLANKYQLLGEVFNNELGVVIFITTSEKKAAKFLNELLEHPPEISIIKKSSIEEIDPRNFKSFRIVTSEKNHKLNLPLTPDFGVCSDCIAEVRDADNRRYQYAFTTCVKCGPRYAITKKYPFERANTSLRKFDMCDTCEAEYTNPKDRRFHSQTNSCPQCGVQLSLSGINGDVVEQNPLKIFQKTAALLSKGKIVAIKNTNGYLLCCDAGNEKAIAELRAKKRRPAKPFALLYPSLNLIKEHFEISVSEEKALVSADRPIVILQSKTNIKKLVTNQIAPGLEQLGVMLPSSALLQLLMDSLKKPVVATSGNIHGSPIISENEIAEKELASVADYFLHHDLDITFPQDDSVIRFAGEQPIILRRSRGMSPSFFLENQKISHPVLAMGAHLKSTFAFVPNGHIYLSQYFGNLDSYDVLERYKATIKNYIALFETTPVVLLMDSHPQYQSSILARELALDFNAEILEIQHHKAHFASVLAEHNLFDATSEKILGVVWDGTGYGEDGAIWGGEFFTYDTTEIVRVSHFEYFNWIAGEKMAREPRLSLLSLTTEENKNQIRDKFDDQEWNIYNILLKKNALKTSSVGRLFDAVASALNIVDVTTYEGEAAMRLETLATSYNRTDLIDFLERTTYENIPTKTLLSNVRISIEAKISEEKIAASFIYSLAKCIVKMAQKQECKIITFSGGVFQNVFLVNQLQSLTVNSEIKLKFNRNLSGNDENIALGQLAYYSNILTI